MLSIQASHQQVLRWKLPMQLLVMSAREAELLEQELVPELKMGVWVQQVLPKGVNGFQWAKLHHGKGMHEVSLISSGTSVLSRRNICFPLRLLMLLAKTDLQFSFDHIMVLAASLHFRLRKHWTPQLGFFPVTQTRRLVFLRVDKKTYVPGLSINSFRNTSYCSLE